jgi:hypothetical protein
MLTFESPFYEISGVVVFRDHASATTFHYLAGPPKLSRSPDGTPNLLLLKYQEAIAALGDTNPLMRDQLGGGFLMFGVDCGLTQAVKDDIVRELESRVPPGSGPVNLVPVLYTQGSVNVIALDSQLAAADTPDDGSERSRFVRGILGTAVPSLLQDQRAIFSLALSADAATLVEDAYASGLSPIGVMYELEFTGLRPALAVRATVDMKRAYESFKMGLHLGVHTGGGTTTPPPVAGGGSTPAVTPGTTPPSTATPGTATPGTTAPGTTAPGTATPGTTTPGTTTPGTTPPPQQPAGVRVGLDVGLAYAVEQLKQSGAISIEIIRQQTGQSVDQMEQSALQLLKETLLNEFFKPAMTDVAAATQAVGAVNQMMATTAGTSQGVAGAAGAATPQTGGTKVELGLQLAFKKEEELKEAVFDYSVIAPETRTHAPNGFFSALLDGTELARHIRSIKLDDDFFRVIEVPITTTADFDRFDIRAITVDLQYGGTVAQPAVAASPVLTKDTTAVPRFQAFVDHDDASFRYRVGYSFGQSEDIAAQRQSVTTPWRTTTTRAVVVHPPQDVGMLQVRVEPGVVDWEVVSQIETTLTYDDAAHAFHTERSFTIGSGSAAQDWIVRLTDPTQTAYTARHVWHLQDQSEIPGPTVREVRPQLPVPDPFVDRLPIRIQPLVDPTSVARVDVELTYRDPAHRFEVHKNVPVTGPDFVPVTQTIPLIDPELREYTYQATLIRKDGQAERQPQTTTDALSILVTEGGAYFDVTITILGDMAQAGLQAVQVDLRAEPMDGARPKVESRLFQPGAAAPPGPVRLLLRVDRPQQFEFRTTAFTADRGPVESAWTVHQNANLVLQPARLLLS